MACLAASQTFQIPYGATSAPRTSQLYTPPARPAPLPPVARQTGSSSYAHDDEVESDPESVLTSSITSLSPSHSELSGSSSSTSLSSCSSDWYTKGDVPVVRVCSPSICCESTYSGEPDAQTLASFDSSSTAGPPSIRTITEAQCGGEQEAPQQVQSSGEELTQRTNCAPWKGKGKLALIRNISWDSVNASDVISFCAAYDRAEETAQGQHHVIMGAAASVEAAKSDIVSLPRRSSPRVRRPQHRRISARPTTSETEQEQQPITAQNIELSNAAKREAQRLAEERAQSIMEWSERLILNNDMMLRRLDALRTEVTEIENAKREQVRLLQERLEEQDRQAALLLQQELEAQAAEERREQERRARIKECSVCGDLMDKDLFPASRTTSKCEHEGMICSECLGSWISSALNDNGPEGIKCPECPEKLTYNDVMAVASKEIADAYDKATTLQALSALEDFAWCLAPGCKSGQQNFQNSNYMECTLCGYKQCLNHKVQWHAGETCAQYDHRESGAKAREEEAKTLAMLDTMSKVCPGPGCGWRIQKTEGCDHVTCRKCQFQFCWQCLASHLEIKSVGNTAHKKECKFHSDNLELAWPFNRH